MSGPNGSNGSNGSGGSGGGQQKGQKGQHGQPGQPGQPGQGKNRRRRSQKQKTVDIWRPVPQLPAPRPITPSNDPAALLRSLGDPPLQGQATVGAHYLFAVAERAAGLATALAAAGDLLAMPDDDAEEP